MWDEVKKREAAAAAAAALVVTAKNEAAEASKAAQAAEHEANNLRNSVANVEVPPAACRLHALLSLARLERHRSQPTDRRAVKCFCAR